MDCQAIHHGCQSHHTGGLRLMALTTVRRVSAGRAHGITGRLQRSRRSTSSVATEPQGTFCAGSARMESSPLTAQKRSNVRIGAAYSLWWHRQGGYRGLKFAQSVRCQDIGGLQRRAGGGGCQFSSGSSRGQPPGIAATHLVGKHECRKIGVAEMVTHVQNNLSPPWTDQYRLS